MKLEIINVQLPLMEEKKLFHLCIDKGKWTQIITQQGEVVDNRFRPEEEINWRAPDETWIRMDARKRIILPGLVDGHVHLDKAHTLSQVGNKSGTLLEAITNYRKAAPFFSKEQIKKRMIKTVLDAASFGTTAMRSHLDFFTGDDGTAACRTVEAALEVKDELSDVMTLQFYAMCDPFTMKSFALDMLKGALKDGIDGIGGAPHLSPNHKESVRCLFSLAEKTGKPLDLHSDETDDPSVNTVSMIAEEVRARGMQKEVTAGHLCSLAAMKQQDADTTMEAMEHAGLHVMTLPGANMYLQGREDRGLIRRGVTRVKELNKRGVNVSVASDNIQDPFHPFGQGDLLEIGKLSTYASHMNSEEERLETLRMITEHPAEALQLPEGEYGVKVEAEASFVLFDCTTVNDLFSSLSPNRTVFRQGRLMAVSKRSTDWFDPSACHLHSDESYINPKGVEVT